MIRLKTAEQFRFMREAGKITGEALLKSGEAVKDGVSTKHIDDVVRSTIEKYGAIPSFLGYGGFPCSACVSINNQVIHGIPSPDTIIREGDIVKIDVGAMFRGFHGDSACTFPCGAISAEAQRLIDVTRESFYRGYETIKAASKTDMLEGRLRLGDVGHAVQTYAEANGFSVVRKFVGHGIGRDLHESPEVPNYGTPGRGQRLMPGMAIALEPMINAGGHEVEVLDDGWTVLTKDNSLSAHYEHTIAITDNGPELLTYIG